MLNPELLRLLCCPETHQPVRLADPEVVAGLNERIVAGAVNSRGGQAVRERIDAGLVREDGRFLYPVRQDIPVMLIDEAIPLSP